MSDTATGTVDVSDVTARVTSDCPDALAGVVSRAVDCGARRWRGELLLTVFGAVPEPAAPREDAIRASTAVELLAGYGHTRRLRESDPTADESESRRTQLILAGDYLHGLAFETVGQLSADPPVVAACFRALTRSTVATSHDRYDTVSAGGEAADGDPTWLPEFGAAVGELAADLGGILGGVPAGTRREIRRAGRVISVAVVSRRGDSSDQVGAATPTPGDANREWEAVARVVDSISAPVVRTELAAFIDDLEAGK